MEEKLKSLKDAAAMINDGDVVAIGNQKPLAIVREIIRQKKKNLTIYFMMGNYEVDLRPGSGGALRVKRLSCCFIYLDTDPEVVFPQQVWAIWLSLPC